MRKGPGTSYGIIKVIDMNVNVTVTEATNSSWYKVKLSDGTEGYLAAQYLKITSGDINSVKPVTVEMITPITATTPMHPQQTNTSALRSASTCVPSRTRAVKYSPF